VEEENSSIKNCQSELAQEKSSQALTRMDKHVNVTYIGRENIQASPRAGLKICRRRQGEENM